MRTEFRISGSGGQGVISAGVMLANSAVACGLHAVQSQSYGPEARGGTSRAEVVISDEEIDYPKAVSPRYVLCLTPEAYNAYGKNTPEGTEVYIDSNIIADDDKARKIPIMDTASKISLRSANVVAVAFLSGLSGLISEEKLREALKAQFPKFYDINVKCAEAGFLLANGER